MHTHSPLTSVFFHFLSIHNNIPRWARSCRWTLWNNWSQFCYRPHAPPDVHP